MTLTVGLLVVLALLAFAAGRLTRRHVPELVAYLLIGALAGPTGLHLLGAEQLRESRPLTIAATALLLALIGERVSLESFRAAPWIAPTALVGYPLAGAAAFLAVRAAGGSNLLALFAAVFAGGGAPMTVAAIVRRAPGEYARALVGVHASCDVLVSLVFALALPVAIASAGTHASVRALPVDVLRLGLAGAALGFLAGRSALLVAERFERRAAAVGLAHLAGAVAVAWAAGLSVPLTGLVLGATIGSARTDAPARRLFDALGRLEPGLYLVFFVLAGAAIRLNALGEFALVGVAYVVARTLGRLAAGVLGGTLAGLPPRRGLRHGLALLPHAGVSSALAAAAAAALPGRGIATVTLGGIVLFELGGALIVRAQVAEPVGEVAVDAYRA